MSPMKVSYLQQFLEDFRINSTLLDTCNWMKFVRKALTYEEQNLILTQESNGLCFTATRSISPHEELKVP